MIFKKKLNVQYNKNKKDFIIKYPHDDHIALVISYFLNNRIINYDKNGKQIDGDSFLNLLYKEGFDIKTLKISCKLRKG